MVHIRQGDHRPVQTSAVIVLGASRHQTTNPPRTPPSPPTPVAFPAARGWCEPADEFSLQETVSTDDPSARERRLTGGLHVLRTEAAALASLARLYEIDTSARRGFDDAVKVIASRASQRGQTVVIGVGKSGLIGKKLVATFQSLGIRAVFLHPTEALHGDLGIVSPDDALLFVTFSGKTQELLLLLPHLDESLPTILLTSHTRRETCEFMKHRPNTILLPAPIPEPETVSFGVAAPSSSTTVAMALGDALAMTAANELHPSVAAAFAKNHPGGAIGSAAASTSASAAKTAATGPAASSRPLTLGQISTALDSIPEAEGLTERRPGLALFRAGFDSKTGWARVGDKIACPSRIRSLSDADMSRPIGEIPGVLVSRQHMVAMSSETTIRQARDILRDMRSSAVREQEPAPCAYSIIAVTKGGYITSVLEVEQVLNHGEGK